MARSKEKKTYSDFENEINAGNLQQVYYVAVSDNYFLRKAEELLREKITGSKDSRESFFIKYADETSGEEIIDLCRNFSSLFSASKIVIVKRCEKFGKKFDTVLEFTQNPDPDTTLLLAFDKEYVTEKKLEKDIQFYDFTDLPEDNFRAWVRSEFQARGCIIEPAELDLFISDIPRNFDLLENEISKISNYCEEVSDGHEIKITKEILYKFTGYDNAYSPEELMSSILRKDARNAIGILDNMLNKGSVNEIYLLNIITGYYMDLMSAKTKDFDSAGYEEIYSKYKIWGDRINFVKSYKNQVNEDDFEQIYAKIIETDKKLKTSMLDSKVLITSLVEELSNI